MISKYNSFLEDKLLESVINESIVYFSPNLRRVIKKVSKTNEIGEELTNVEGQDIKQDITFLDLDKEGYLSFITMRNAVNLAKVKYPHIVDGGSNSIDITSTVTADSIWRHDIEQDYNDLGIYKKSRNQIKIGKLINRLFPNKFTDKQIEEFVNTFKATIENQGEKIRVVEGSDISFWYDSSNYKERSGTLGNSCMASKSNIFQLYTHNPEVCKMVILVEDDKLLGRALVWKLNSINKTFEKTEEGATQSVELKPEYFMDRQYTINDSDVIKFQNYAKENGWSYKSNNNHHSLENITFFNTSKRVNMTVTVKPYKGDSDYEYSRYPYLDTFRRYDPETGYLYNDEDTDSDNAGNYILDNTGGGFTEIERGVYSEWCDCTIDEDDAVYSDRVDSYLRRDDAVMVELGPRSHRGWWPSDHDDIVFDDGRDEYIHRDDSRYCEIDGSFIFEDDAVMVVSDIESDGEINEDDMWMRQDDSRIVSIYGEEIGDDKLWYKKLCEIDSNWENNTHILKKLLIKDYNNEWIPKKFSIVQSKISEPLESEENPADITGYEYLNEIDALALGYSVEKYNTQTIDVFTYTKNISDILSSIKVRLRIKLEKIDFELSGKQLSLIEDTEYKRKLVARRNWILERIEEIEEERWT